MYVVYPVPEWLNFSCCNCNSCILYISNSYASHIMLELMIFTLYDQLPVNYMLYYCLSFYLVFTYIIYQNQLHNARASRSYTASDALVVL